MSDMDKSGVDVSKMIDVYYPKTDQWYDGIDELGMLLGDYGSISNFGPFDVDNEITVTWDKVEKRYLLKDSFGDFPLILEEWNENVVKGDKGLYWRKK